MNQILPTPMTVDEFLRWSARQERGHYELEGGRVMAAAARVVPDTCSQTVAMMLGACRRCLTPWSGARTRP